MRLLDRYVIRNFLQAYVYCIVGFISIWLIYDISDNISTFLDAKVRFTSVIKYYLLQTPQILVVLLPVSLLLALLFSLGRMSRANEIVSMLTAGIGIPRLLAPLIAVGLLTTGVSMALNFSLAPHAEQARKTVLEVHAAQREAGITGQVFRNRSDNRTWFISQFRPGDNIFRSVQVLQEDEQGHIVKNYVATDASYHPENHTWEFHLGKLVRYDEHGNIIGGNDEIFGSLVVNDWSETPFRLASANMQPDFLSVPELQEYLRSNADFPHSLLAPFATQLQNRLALPWACLLVVFIGAPLGIGYSRRGVLASVASAIALIFSMNFLTHLFLALGEGARISPVLAAWTPNLLFAVVGLLLLYFRATNRELPKWNLFAARRLAVAR
jgi:LPS export ABC transporter permease LptG